MSHQKQEKPPSLLSRFTPFMGRRQSLLYLSLILSGLSAALHIVPFWLIWLVVREILSNLTRLNLTGIGRYAWFAFGAEILSLLLYFSALICSHFAAFRVEIGMQKVGMKRIINLPLGFFDLNASGRMRKIVNDGAATTHTFLAHQLPDLAGTLISPILILILSFAVDWRMSLAMLAPLLFAFGTYRVMMNQNSKDFQKEYFDALEKMSSEAVEYVRGIPVVKTFGQSVFSFKRFYNSIIRYKDMVYAYTLSWRKPMSFFIAIMQTMAFFLIPAALLLISRTDNLGMVLTDFIFYLMISPVFAMLAMKSMYATQNTMLAAQAIDRFDQLLAYPEMSFSAKPVQISDNTLSFKNVSFSYPGSDRPAVEQISFEVKAGETVALVGPSGGGKTTISRLAARFWDVSEGEVLIGGVNVNEIPKEELMRKISFVFQTTNLFKESLRDNVRYGNKQADQAAIDRAIDLSQAREIIDQLPQGLDTVIGSKGTYLSGGEQQRIALARAILKNAPIILLDEATAFADPENENKIQEALRELCRDKTTLMIAHRLTSVTQADRILVIEQGRIAESGTHEELLSLDGTYASMWHDYLASLNWQVASNVREDTL